MPKTFDASIELARYFDDRKIETKVTISDYQKLVSLKDREAIANFIYYRLHSRYIKPLSFIDADYTTHYKNGFSIIANCCLLIETLESFKKGWGDSNSRSEQSFVNFLSSDRRFISLNGKAREFYKSVRCGILHQGETTSGWTITRKGNTLFDIKALKINANVFLSNIEKSLNDYRQQLIMSNWDDEIWDNCRTKMRKIVSNCQR